MNDPDYKAIIGLLRALAIGFGIWFLVICLIFWAVE